MDTRDEHHVPQSMLQEIHEDKILREAIYALQGIDGEQLQFDWSSPELHRQRLKLVAPLAVAEASIPPNLLVHSKLGSGVADSLSIIGEAGWLYTRLQAYIRQVRESSDAGAMQRGLTTALVSEVNAYQGLLVHLESQTIGSSGGHLRQLLTSLHLPLRRLHSLAMLTDGLTVNMTGGPLLRALHQHSRHGDARHRELVLSLLAASSRPWFDMLWDWISQGNLPEKREFFVADSRAVADQDLWRERYHIDELHLPPSQILPADFRLVVFELGKGINFIRHCLVDGEYSLGDTWEDEARGCFAYQPSPTDGSNALAHTFCRCLQQAADEVNTHILQSLREEHNVVLHMFCLKQFLLLGQGDFVATLTEALHNEYQTHKGLVGVYRHTLAAFVEGALRSSNAVDLPEECLQRLQVDLRMKSDDAVAFKFGPDKETEKDTRTVWDVFQLSYTVPEPTKAIFEPKLMDQYKSLFSHLFTLRKIEYFLNYTWRQSAMLSHALHAVAQFSAIKASGNPHYAQALLLLRRIAITRQSMTHFVVNLKSFLMVEVIEGGWKHLKRQVEEAESLDALIAAHEEFVAAVGRQSLVQSKDDDIRGAVKDLLELCDQFSSYQQNLFDRALKAADLAAEKRRVASERQREGEWGFDDADNTQTEETTFFGLADASKLQELDTISVYFQDTILSLLQALDRKLHGSRAANSAVQTPSTPSRGIDSRQNVEALRLDTDLKLLRFLRAQLDQNQFYEKILAS
jgi:gamma-tubulin complex component 3